MFPAVFLALPLLLPMSDRVGERRVDVITSAPMIWKVPADRRDVVAARPAPLIPPLYAQADGAFTVSLSPGSPCTGACLKLQGTF